MIEATLRNMREHTAEDLVAYSPVTGEQGSANPADYWWMADAPDTPLTDREGNAMQLGHIRPAEIRPA